MTALAPYPNYALRIKNYALNNYALRIKNYAFEITN